MTLPAPEPLAPADPHPRTPLVALMLLATLYGLTAVRYQPPPVVEASAPPDAFSAQRAARMAARILGEQEPHPVGSPANEAVKRRLIAELRGLGLQPRVQDTFQIAELYGNGAQVKNVMARLEGKQKAPALLLLAHYDSREAAPGAGDDMAGVVAILETVRALKTGPPLERTVIALITDGEEAGLIGADAFIQQHPWFEDVGVVLNVEGRGNTGPSLMFQTGPDNAELVRRWASAATRPIGGSTYSTIYEYLPNNTDFTPFIKPREIRQKAYPGRQGLNFAFVGRVAHYHTSEDSLQNLDLRSLQHHGDNLLGLTRDLARGPPLSESGDAVYFDVFAAFVVGWPEGASVPLALLAVILALAPAFMLARRGRGRHLIDPERLRLSEVLWGLLAVVGSVVVGGLFAVVLGWVVRGATPTPFVASPGPLVALFWASAIAAVVLVGLALPRCTFWGTATAVWLTWALGGLAFAATLPGISYLLLVPALAYGAVATLLTRMGKEGCRQCAALVALAPLLAAASLYLPTTHMLVDSMGIGHQAPTAFVMVVFLTTATPLFARRELLVPPAALLVLLGILTVTLVGSLTSSPYTPASPRRMNLCLRVDASAGSAQWLLLTPGEELPEPARGHGFSATRQPVEGLRGKAFVAPASSVPAPPPNIHDLQQEPIPGGRRVRFLLRSSRGATEAALVFPRSALLQTRVDGELVEPGVRIQGQTPPFVRTKGGQAVVWCNALPPGGLQIELQLKGQDPVECTLLDSTPGLPPAGQQLLEVIRGPAAVSSYKGDQLIVSRRLQL